MDDATKRVNGEANVSKKSSVPSRYQQFMTSEDEASSQTSSAHSSEDEEEEEKEMEKKGGTTVRSITSTHSVSSVKTETLVSTVPAKETRQVLKLANMHMELNNTLLCIGHFLLNNIVISHYFINCIPSYTCNVVRLFKGPVLYSFSDHYFSCCAPAEQPRMMSCLK